MDLEVIRMKLKKGTVYDNYIALCKDLGIVCKTGKSKQLQMEELKRVCNYEKIGHKIHITEVKASVEPKVDKRGKSDGSRNNNSKYAFELDEVFKDYLSNIDSHKKHFKSKRVLLKELNIINLVNYEWEINRHKAALVHNKLFETVSSFYPLIEAKTMKILGDTINSSFDRLKNLGAVEGYLGYVLSKRIADDEDEKNYTEVNDGIGCRVATLEEEELINKHRSAIAKEDFSLLKAKGAIPANINTEHAEQYVMSRDVLRKNLYSKLYRKVPCELSCDKVFQGYMFRSLTDMPVESADNSLVELKAKVRATVYNGVREKYGKDIALSFCLDILMADEVTIELVKKNHEVDEENYLAKFGARDEILDEIDALLPTPNRKNKSIGVASEEYMEYKRELQEAEAARLKAEMKAQEEMQRNLEILSKKMEEYKQKRQKNAAV